MSTKTGHDCNIAISHVMLPQDANPAGNVHGGIIMKHIDSAAGVVAARHARQNVVTASIDRLDFHHPVFVGDLLTLSARLYLVNRTSMEIGVYAETEKLTTGEIRHVASAFLTFVALDDEGRPVTAPPMDLLTEDDRRRHRGAMARRKARLDEKERAEACRININHCD